MTRNIRDFKRSMIPVYSSNEIEKMIKAQRQKFIANAKRKFLSFIFGLQAESVLFDFVGGIPSVDVPLIDKNLIVGS